MHFIQYPCVMENTQTIKEDDFPHADSAAAIMLRNALDRYVSAPGKSLRKLGAKLGYKQAAILSHMASGRVPIPLDRADELARALDINPREFVENVLIQRHPGAYHALQLSSSLTSTPPFLPRLEEHGEIIMQVLQDIRPAQRWLSEKELLTIMAIREARPNFKSEGLSTDELQQILAILKNAPPLT